MEYRTIPEIFVKQCNKYGKNKVAFKFKKGGEYVGLDYMELKGNVEKFALALKDKGIAPGDRVGIVSENRIEWIVADFAITGLGAVDVPIFPTHTAIQEEFIFNNCGAKAIIVSNNYQLRKILEVVDNLKALEFIVVMNDKFDDANAEIYSMSSLIKDSDKKYPEGERSSIFEESALKVNPDDLLTIIYTSGTTGNPKGVMLTNKNIVSNIKSIYDTKLMKESDELLSFLPICHAYERTTGYYAAFMHGAIISFAESIETVSQNILEIRPTLMTTVPRLLEIIKKKVFSNADKESPFKKKIFYWAVKTGKEYLKKNGESAVTVGLKAKYALADKLVFSKIKEKTGGRLRKFVSGGAPLPDIVAEFFLSMGITVIEGYGLTEASPVVSVNMPGEIEIGTIGKPLPGVTVEIAADGELLVKGDNVMRGYWENPDATKQTINEGGWLLTGDVGIITDKGNIKITDRKKNIFVNSGGKNIAPQQIENLLASSIYIEHAIILGDSRDYITALLTPDYNQLKILAGNMNIEFDSETGLISNKEVIKEIKRDIDELQKGLAKYERVRKFKLLSEPFTIENGELTPKLSIKRHVVEKKYSEEISELYNE